MEKFIWMKSAVIVLPRCFLVLIVMVQLSKMLTLGEAGQKVVGNSLYYCYFSVGLKLFKNKKLKGKIVVF